MARQRPFREVDVFTTTPYFGNPVAVVLEGDGLSTDEMQRFAHWTNLSETTFVLPPSSAEADYRVRIFTPNLELPFAGHPTLGTCHAWLETGRGPHDPDAIVQECAAGLVTVKRTDAGLAFGLLRGSSRWTHTIIFVSRLAGWPASWSATTTASWRRWA